MESKLQGHGTTAWSYQYDAESRMTQALKDGTVVLENGYDPAGMRVKKSSQGKTTYTVYSGANPILEYDQATGEYTYYIYAGTRSVAEEKGGKKTFYHRDHLGSTRATTDDTGKITGLCKYDAWGNLESVNEFDEGLINGETEITDSLGNVKHWTSINDQEINKDCTYQPGQGINGSSALRIERISGSANTAWTLPNIYASPDTNYELTGYYLSGNALSNKARAQLVYYNTAGEEIAIHDTGALGHSGEDWKRFTLTSHAPADAASMEIRLTQDADPGMAVLFDGIKLKIPGLAGKYDYTGKKEDPEIGLKYFGARFYDAEVGRFTTIDPAKDGANWFAYCNNNPIIAIDPDGRETVVIIVREKILGIWVGTHAALYVDNPSGSPVLYDPAGSTYEAKDEWGYPIRGTGDAFSGEYADLDAYVQSYKDNDKKIELIRFDTTAKQEKKIAENIDSQGGAGPLFCSTFVSRAIIGIGPFKELEGSFFPGILSKQLNEIKEKKKDDEDEKNKK